MPGTPNVDVEFSILQNGCVMEAPTLFLHSNVYGSVATLQPVFPQQLIYPPTTSRRTVHVQRVQSHLIIHTNNTSISTSLAPGGHELLRHLEHLSYW